MKFVTLDNLRKVWASMENKINEINYEVAADSEIENLFSGKTYSMVESSSLASSGSDAVFRSEAPYADFQSVKVNGNIVSSSNYTVSEGSTKVQLKKSYIGTLGNGSHELEIVSKDGSAKSNFTVDKMIMFSICGNYYTATKGMTWAQWIMSYGIGATGNNIVWVGLDNSTIYQETRTSTGGSLPTSSDIIYTSNSYGGLGTEQTVRTIIEDGMSYITPSYWSKNPDCCFDAGSQILMADGTTKNIEDVVIGDEVISLNTETGEFIVQKVNDTITNPKSTDLVYVNLSNGTRLAMRAYHPLLTTEGWKSLRPELAETKMDVKEVQLLEIGDTLVGYKENAKVVSVDARPEVENYPTYNLSIDGYHNYIVDGIIAHNAACPT